jgi:dTDP-4-amino-4,6-dideoxygalactose transaminase
MSNIKIIQAPRASAILYGLLTSCPPIRPWLLPANICPIVPISFLKAGIPFEFVDISPATLRMDFEQVEAQAGKRKIGGLLYAHPYGEVYTPNDFFLSLKDLNPDILIVDDRCLCIPETTPNESTAADVTLFSTGNAKIAELNYGGYAFLKPHIAYQPVHLPFDPIHYDTLEKDYKEALRNRSRFHYQDTDWLETETPQPQWEAYREQIEQKLQSTLQHRAALNVIYENNLPEEIQLPKACQSWRFNIRVKNKKEVLRAIFAEGLFASSHYASLAGIMADGHAPNAEIFANEVINFFNDEHFDEEKAQKTCDIISRSL